MDTPDDRRDATRIPLEAEVVLEFTDMDEMLSEFSRNVSLGGIFIGTYDPRPVGSAFHFELNVGGAQPFLAGTAEVAWVRDQNSSGPGKPAGMGARFVALEGESRARIFHIVDHYVTATGGPAFDVEAGP
jgi:uncharacterized protein (TIGR02266 family)